MKNLRGDVIAEFELGWPIERSSLATSFHEGSVVLFSTEQFSTAGESNILSQFHIAGLLASYDERKKTIVVRFPSLQSQRPNLFEKEKNSKAEMDLQYTERCMRVLSKKNRVLWAISGGKISSSLVAYKSLYNMNKISKVND